jgi:hypothetical protein
MYGSLSFTNVATLIVVAEGRLEKRVTRMAAAHAAFDPDSRTVMRPGDALYPPQALLEPWTSRGAAALVVNASGHVCAVLDSLQATTAGWIEDAFLSARRRGER